jgi:hypothetical protein
MASAAAPRAGAPRSAALGVRIASFPGQAVEGAHGHVGEEAVHEEPAERRRVRRLDADVFVEVERGDAVPGDRAVAAQGGQELVLRRRGREDRRRPSVPLDLARRWADTAAAAARPIVGRSGWTSTSRRPRDSVGATSATVASRISRAAQRTKCGSATSGSSSAGCQRFSHSNDTQRS